ncbi:CDP-glucose 4,6-dehydratase [Oceaniferula spumae]|uniref:CDP-glucose 4,6-dehydratase n=1 Tax=Oceaniferula spumae TaxID=2979115 RepID=A0AAT9FLF7_9BACT
MPFHSIYAGKKVLVTGHTGFKGSWLCEWLLGLDAEVTGYALDPLADTDLFCQLDLASRLHKDVRADLSDLQCLTKLVADLKPDFVFHLAAQPLVRLSYAIPVETFATNVMGSIHLMEALRLSNHDCSVVMVTTDKCYQNREWLSSYREQDAMGGHDPYSASKGAAEIAIASYRDSYFSSAEGPVRIASGRAGNVIGGGDWAADRIIPDCIRAIGEGKPITVRNKTATRPWQHVLEPLSGYLWLGAALSEPSVLSFQNASALAGGFNFGPSLPSNKPVSDLVREFIKHTGGEWIDASEPDAPHEASKLNLAIDKAFHLLQWQPVWDFSQTVKYTAEWYLGADSPAAARKLTQLDISNYTRDASGLAWADSR